MKFAILIFLFLIITAGNLVSQANTDFDTYFEDKTLRVDYYHTADAETEFFSLDKMYMQGTWAGNTSNLIDKFNNGRYYIKVYDLHTGQLIFSRGYDSSCAEYRTSGPALKGIKKTFHESALIPYPKDKVKFVLESRAKNKQLHEIYSHKIDPAGFDINKEPLISGVKVFEFLKNGNPHKKVDIAFIAEGYTAGEEEKFEKDGKRFTNLFFEQEPYKTYNDRFNIYGVFKASQNSGCDEPRMNIFKNTAVGATFNSMGSERYVLTEENKNLRDIAAHAPYDALVILINHDRYGGGGIYNFFCTVISDNQWHKYLFLHELGHSFSGLADEYYTSSTAYNEFYPLDIEPTEPNITALLDKENVKWKDLLTPGIDIPTPWEKDEYDKMSFAYQKVREELNNRVAFLTRNKAPENEIREAREQSERLSREHAQDVDHFLWNSKYQGKVGAFEGAGYASRGLYRSMVDCIMFTKGDKPYCDVCENAIIKVIKHYSE